TTASGTRSRRSCPLRLVAKLPARNWTLEERKVRSGWTYVEKRWIVFDETGRHEFRFDLRIYSGRELECLLQQAGFRQIALYGNLKGDSYDDSAERLIAVATK